MQRTFTDDDAFAYKSLRNLCHKLIRKDKEQIIHDKFKEAEGNYKKQWKTTNDELGWNK